MAMVYDLPTVEATARPTTQVATPQAQNLAAEQAQQGGAAMTKAGATMMAIADHIQNNIDTAAAQELDNKVAESIRTRLRDADNGYLGTLGKSAVDGRGQAVKDIQDIVKSYEEKAGNDMQRAMVRKAANARYQAAMSEVDNHAMKQTIVWRAGETEAGMKNDMADAISDASNYKEQGSQYQIKRALTVQKAGQLAVLNGAPEGSEQYKMAVRDTTTKLHVAVLDQFIKSENVDAARDYFKDNKDQIDPSKYDDIGKAIEHADSYNSGTMYANATWETATKGKDYNSIIDVEGLKRDIEKDGALSKEAKAVALHQIQALETSRNHQLDLNAHGLANSVLNQIKDRTDMATYNKLKQQVLSAPASFISQERKDAILDTLDRRFYIREQRAAAMTEARIAKLINNQNAADDAVNRYAGGTFKLPGYNTGFKMTKQEARSYGASQGWNAETANRFANIIDKINTNLTSPKVSFQQFDQFLLRNSESPAFRAALGFDPRSKESKGKKLQLLNATLDIMGAAGEGGPKNQMSIEAATTKALQKVKYDDSWFFSSEVPRYRINSMSEADKRKFVIYQRRSRGLSIDNASVDRDMQKLNAPSHRGSIVPNTQNDNEE